MTCRLLSRASFFVGGAIALSCASASQAGVIAFSNFDTDAGFNDQFGWSASFATDVAMSFEAGAGGNVTDIDIGLMGGFGVWGIVHLHADDSGTPGSILGTWNLTVLPAVNSDPDPVHIDVTETIPVVAGQTYWLSAEFDANSPGIGSVLWGFNTIGGTGTVATGSVGGSWTTESGTPGAFSVTVPAPGAIGAIAVSMLLGRRRRRR